MATATPMGPRRAGPLPRDVARDASRDVPNHVPSPSHVPAHLDESEQTELAALRDENKELRELVIQLSKLVIRNVMEHK